VKALTRVMAACLLLGVWYDDGPLDWVHQQWRLFPGIQGVGAPHLSILSYIICPVRQPQPRSVHQPARGMALLTLLCMTSMQTQISQQ